MLLLEKALPSREEPDISLAIVRIARFYTHITRPKHSSTLNTHSNNFIQNMLRHIRGKIASGVAMRGDGGVAGEGKIVCVPNAPCH